MKLRNGLVWSGVTIGFLALGIVGITVYRYVKEGLDQPPAQAVLLKGEPACNPLGRACVAADAAIAIALELADSIKPLTPFPVRVRLAGERAARAERVAVSFTMTDMDMGFNRFELRQTAADGTWQGQALLPVCSAGRRDWRVTVDVAGDRAYVGEFHLLTRF